MTNSKTKRALCLSLLSMLVCVSMLIGTTFAWFTDTASTGVNRIQAGTLDVALEVYDADEGEWVDAEGKTLDFVKAPGAPADEPILWEPGCTYELPAIRIVNKGNLAIKYKLMITGINGDEILNEVIEWTIDGLEIGTEYKLAAGSVSDALTITGHMKETAGNEYQGLSIDGISITVVATQDTVESDSYDNQYDAGATYLNKDESGNWLISNAAELFYFAKTVNSGNNYKNQTVILTADIDLANAAWTPISGFLGTFDGNGKTISNLYVNMPGAEQVGLFGYQSGGNIRNVTVDGAYVYGYKYAGVISGHGYANITDCTVKNAVVTATGKRAGAVVGFVGEADIGGTQVVRDNKAINCTVYVGERVSEPNNICVGTFNDTSDLATQYLNSNTAENSSVHLLVSNGASLKDALQGGGNITLASNITVPADTEIVLTNVTANLYLNGYTIHSTSSVSTSNRCLFTVGGNGVLNVFGDGAITYRHIGSNMGWNYMTTIFNIHGGGVVNVKDATFENLGGSDMAFVVHLNNWGTATFTADNAVIKSTYTAIRVFNSGNHMNTVTVSNGSTIFGGSRAVWIQNNPGNGLYAISIAPDTTIIGQLREGNTVVTGF